jgi:TonB family protein
MMDRLQKKCFIASAGVHLLLALILLVGPAFLVSKSKPDDLPILDFVPLKTVDALVSGGGNPHAKPPPPAPATKPEPPAPPPPQPEKVQPDPPKELARENKPEPKPPVEESFIPSPDPKPKKVEISTKLVTRTRDTKSDTKAREEAKAREAAKEWADSRRRMVSAIDRVTGHISSEVSGGTTIELKGPGGGGVPYANFLQAVKTVYTRAWIVPDGVTDDDGTVAASVTIAKDGTVVSAHITRRSGNSGVDQSVQATLDRVRFAAPLPDDAAESQRTVTINFNVKAKRSLG